MKSIQLSFTLQSTVTFFLIVSIMGCTNESSNEETATKDTSNTGSAVANQLVFDKLVGTWQSEDGKSFERWTKKADGLFHSSAFSIKGNDTSWNEEANIYPENENWVFENTVRGQNGGKAVKFVSSSLNESSVQFSNPAHDFPTDINYTVRDANTVNAFIAGPNDKGGKDTMPFNYVRIK